MERPIRRVVESAVVGMAMLAVSTLPLLAQTRKHTPNGCDIGRWHYFMQPTGVYSQWLGTQSVLTLTLEDDPSKEFVMYSDESLQSTAVLHGAIRQEIVCESEEEIMHDTAALAKSQEKGNVRPYLSDMRGIFYRWDKPRDPTLCVNVDSDDVNDPNWTEVVLSLDDYTFTVIDDHGVAQEIIVAAGGNVPVKVDTYQGCNTVQERSGPVYNYGTQGEFQSPDQFAETVAAKQEIPTSPLYLPLTQISR